SRGENVPDGTYAVEEQIAEGDRVVTRGSFRGTAKRSTGDPSSPGKPVTMTGIEIYEVRDGKIVESWGITDETDLPTLKLPLDHWRYERAPHHDKRPLQRPGCRRTQEGARTKMRRTTW